MGEPDELETLVARERAERRLEALLFASPGPVSAAVIAERIDGFPPEAFHDRRDRERPVVIPVVIERVGQVMHDRPARGARRDVAAQPGEEPQEQHMGGGEVLELVDEQQPTGSPGMRTGNRVGEQDLDGTENLFVEVDQAGGVQALPVLRQDR